MVANNCCLTMKCLIHHLPCDWMFSDLGGHGHWGTYSKPSWTSELLFDLHQASSVALMRFVVFITLKTKTVVFWFIKPCNLMITNFGRNVLSSSCGTGCGRKTWRFLS
jgi:hypothetical protein